MRSWKNKFLLSCYMSMRRNIMFCMNCGKEIPNESKFCQFCGSAQGLITSSEEVEQQTSSQNLDLLEVFAEFAPWDNPRSQIDVTSKIREIRGVSVSEALDAYKNAINDAVLVAKAKELKATWDSSVTTCPKCHSNQTHIDKKGYGLKKGIIGGILLGPVGLLAGKHKSNEIRFTCLSCGHQWSKQ